MYARRISLNGAEAEAEAETEAACGCGWDEAGCVRGRGTMWAGCCFTGGVLRWSASHAHFRERGEQNGIGTYTLGNTMA
jgi:hypothetical protein